MSRVLAAALTVMMMLALAGCGQGQSVSKHGDMELRTDLEPLVARVPGLAGVKGAVWTSGTLGDPNVPGPNLYWIDAVVDLEGENLAQVTAHPGLAEQPLSADLVPVVLEHVPSGELLAAEGLNGDLSSADWRVEAWFSPTHEQLVLLITGQ